MANLTAEQIAGIKADFTELAAQLGEGDGPGAVSAHYTSLSVGDVLALCDLALRGLAPLPDTEDDVNAAKDEGADYVLDGLAKALGLKQWVNKDGSESWDGDVSATLMSVLYDAKVLDPETNDRLASLPEGYALLPIEPTEAMIAAGSKAVAEEHGAELDPSIEADTDITYRAMLAASPATEQPS